MSTKGIPGFIADSAQRAAELEQEVADLERRRKPVPDLLRRDLGWCRLRVTRGHEVLRELADIFRSA